MKSCNKQPHMSMKNVYQKKFRKMARDNYGSGSSSSVLNHTWICIVGIILCSSSLSWSYKERVRPKYGVLRPGGGERIGEIMSNGVGEPSCEELRAMWRYHKRQSRRAELTNQIPAFEPIYWQLPPPGAISSFGPLKNFKLGGRSRSMYSHRHGPYGHINYFGSQKQRMRPMDELIRIQPPKQQEEQKPVITQPVVHLSPPSEGTPNTSFQRLQQLILEERQKQQQQQRENGDEESEDDDGDNKSNKQEKTSEGNYGTLILSPPKGQNGRLANKPPEMMSPFEKLRFGHMNLDNALHDETDEGRQKEQKRGLFYYPIRAARVREREQQQQMTRTTTTSPPPANPSLPHASIPSVFSFWRRQLVSPQDAPSSIRMVDTLPSCSLVQGLQCTLNHHCTCSGNGLYRCSDGQCHFLPTAPDDSSKELVLQPFSPFYSQLGLSGNNEWEMIGGGGDEESYGTEVENGMEEAEEDAETLEQEDTMDGGN